MPLIIVEGCDGSGKSSIVSQLNLHLPDATTSLHRGPLKRDPLIEYIDELIPYSPDAHSVICDRWHIGEMVYGPLYRGESRLTPAMNLYVEMFLASRGALKLWMNTPYEIVNAWLSGRGEDFLQEQHQRLVVDWYAEALGDDESWTPVPWKYSPDFVQKMVTLAYARAAGAAQRMRQFPSYVGVAQPSVLIVGKQVLPPQAEGWPFNLVPWRNSPVHTILTAMDMLNIRDVGLVSELKNVRKLWESLMRPSVFTLDRQSWMYLSAHEVPAQLLSLPPRGIPITQLVKTLMERTSA